MNSPVTAEGDGPVQMDEILCVHLIDLSEEEFSFFLAWLDGYFNHMHGTAILSDAGLESLGAIVIDGCTKEPDRNVMDLLTERMRLGALRQNP
jgi:hypothetical protein